MKTTIKTAIAIVLICAVGSVQCAQRVWNIDSFGAVADAKTINTQAIQRAIDECHARGGGKVLIDKGVYLSGTIMLKNNVTLQINGNATLRGSANPLDYKSLDPFTDATGQKRGEALIGSVNAHNVGICGQGSIEGQGERFHPKEMRQTLTDKGIYLTNFNTLVKIRPFLVRFVRTTCIELRDIKMRQPAAWTCHFYQCRDIDVAGVSIYSHAHKNNDGFDFDSCDGVKVRDCDIDTGDDALCFKTTSTMPCSNIDVRQCTLRSEWGAIKFGTESMGNFNNIVVRDCKIRDTRGGGIKILSVDGANISNIEIANIEMDNVEMPIFIRLGERLGTYRDLPRQKVGSIDNVRISNVVAQTRSGDSLRVNPASGVFITGTPNYKIGKVKLRNIHITLHGGGTHAHSLLEPAEDIERYPEASFFGILPSYGNMARHVKELTLNKVKYTLKESDLRPENKLTDVERVIIIK